MSSTGARGRHRVAVLTGDGIAREVMPGLRGESQVAGDQEIFDTL